MSIRIQNDQTADIASASAQRTEAATRITAGGAKSAGGISSGEDHVEVSSTASSIGAAISANNAARSTRVQQLGVLYASGQYSPDSLRTSQALVSGALGAAGGSHL